MLSLALALTAAALVRKDGEEVTIGAAGTLLRDAPAGAATEEKLYDFGKDFMFGVAIAPAQSEDGLQDAWLTAANHGDVPHFQSTPHAADRLRFWSEPEKEINLAKETNSQVFRFGVDWGRLMPKPGEFDDKVMERYKEIVQMVRDA